MSLESHEIKTELLNNNAYLFLFNSISTLLLTNSYKFIYKLNLLINKETKKYRLKKLVLITGNVCIWNKSEFDVIKAGWLGNVTLM